MWRTTCNIVSKILRIISFCMSISQKNHHVDWESLMRMDRLEGEKDIFYRNIPINSIFLTLLVCQHTHTHKIPCYQQQHSFGYFKAEVKQWVGIALKLESVVWKHETLLMVTLNNNEDRYDCFLKCEVIEGLPTFSITNVKHLCVHISFCSSNSSTMFWSVQNILSGNHFQDVKLDIGNGIYFIFPSFIFLWVLISSVPCVLGWILHP